MDAKDAKKKRKDMSYQDLQEFFQKYFVIYMNGRLSKIRSVHTYGVRYSRVMFLRGIVYHVMRQTVVVYL